MMRWSKAHQHPDRESLHAWMLVGLLFLIGLAAGGFDLIDFLLPFWGWVL